MTQLFLAALLFFTAGGAARAVVVGGGGEWREVSGTLRQVDHQKKSIAIEPAQASGQSMIIQIDPSTTILIDGQLSALDELPRGAEVRASFQEAKDRRRAQWIEVQRVRAAQAHPQPPESPKAGQR
ncbi:MAG: hypothetical protein LBM75_03970 [Myxococcales bacterium]|jgi:hypothetical protein|nr:hypothetical protein [Myxococcales bacterium]